MKKIESLFQIAKTLPKTPGCYLMKNKRQDIIYIGKAKNLKQRVCSYFDKSQKFSKTQALVKNIHEFEFILTNTEIESLILENNLIKKHGPKYNIRLRDDKTYPYIQINHNEKFPQIIYTRKPKYKKGHKVLGPYPEGYNLKEAIKAITKIYKLRDCSIYEFRSRKSPCILHQMNQCSAPCVDYINVENYKEDLKNASSFFTSQTRRKEIQSNIRKMMHSYSQSEEFERAIILRDSLTSIDAFINSVQSQKVELNKSLSDVDLFSFHFHHDEVDLSFYEIRNSLLIGSKNINFFNTYENEQEFISELPSLLFSYYSDHKHPPKFIFHSLESQTMKQLNELLSTLTDKSISSKVCPTGLKSLLDVTKEHASNSQRMRKENYQNIFKGLKRLQSLIGLDEMPRHLECYDVAVWQGQSPTSAKISFKDGKADKKNYRAYHLKVRPEGNNDFAMLEETLTRRLKSGNYPDVFIVDGGKQQLNTFKKVLEENEVNIPVVAIAKAKATQTKHTFRNQKITKSQERLFIPNRVNPYPLEKCIELYRIVTQMRDEAHRFSRKLHHKSEHKQFIHSDLSKIEGVGKVTIQKVLSVFQGDISELSKLNPKEMSINFKISEKAALKIINFLKKV